MTEIWRVARDTQALQEVLDKNEPPVARFRLLSLGISSANALEKGSEVTGDPGCIACGNCVDACPIVLRRFGSLELSTERTSMYLEQATGEQCLRCYACIRSCPQVRPELKRFAVRFRIGEKISHWWMAISYMLLAFTGITLGHFRTDWSTSFGRLMGYVHLTLSVFFIITPLLYMILDFPHFKQMLKRAWIWNRQDFKNLKDWWRVFTRRAKAADIFQGEFHPGQKLWYMWVLTAMMTLGITGISRWALSGVITEQSMSLLILVHTAIALITDIIFVFHFYNKFLGRLLRRTKVNWSDVRSNNTKPGSGESYHNTCGGEI